MGALSMLVREVKFADHRQTNYSESIGQRRIH